MYKKKNPKNQKAHTNLLGQTPNTEIHISPISHTLPLKRSYRQTTENSTNSNTKINDYKDLFVVAVIYGAAIITLIEIFKLILK